MTDLLPWLRLIARRRKRLVNGALLILLTLLAGVALLSVSGWFITASALTGLLLAAGLPASLNIYVPGGSIRLFAVTRTVARYLERVYNHNTVLRLLADIRVAVFRGLSRASLSVRTDRSGASWLNRFTSDVDTLNTLYLRLLAPTAMAVLTSLSVIGLAWLLGNGEMALVLAGLLATAFIVASITLYWRTRRSAGNQVVLTEQLRQSTVAHVEGQAELVAAGLADADRQALLARASDYTHWQEHLDRRTGWHLAMTNGLVHLASVSALWSGLALFQSGAISGPVAVLLPLAVLGLQEALAALPDAFGQLGATVVAARRLNGQSGELHTEGTPPDNINGQWDSVRNQTGERLVFESLDFENIVFEHVAFENRRVTSSAGLAITGDKALFSLSVAAGEHVGIIGPSGCGKSTLADIAAGLRMPAQGTCHRGGEQSDPAPTRDWLRSVSYLTQATELFDDSVRANLLIGNPQASDAMLWQVLEVVDLAGLLSGLPSGLDTRVGAYGRQLSGGEGRRLALARTLLRQAPLVILDEPFTGVDQATRERIKARLTPLLAGRTLLALGHSADAMPPVDRIVSLGGGAH